VRGDVVVESFERLSSMHEDLSKQWLELQRGRLSSRAQRFQEHVVVACGPERLRDLVQSRTGPARLLSRDEPESRRDADRRFEATQRNSRFVDLVDSRLFSRRFANRLRLCAERDELRRELGTYFAGSVHHGAHFRGLCKRVTR